MTAVVVDGVTPIDDVDRVDVAGMSDGGLVELMAAARRLASRVQVVELAAVAELARRRYAEDEACGVEVISPAEYLTDEVAQALTLTAMSADDLIRFATDLTHRLPGTFAALAAGDVDYAKARTIWHCTAAVTDEIAAAVEERVLGRAPAQTTGELRAKIRRMVKRLDPDALARRRERATKRRDVQLVETDDDTAHLSGVDLPADAASAAYNRINAIAAGLRGDGDRRGIGQLRADVFLGLLSGTLTATEPPADPTARPVPDTASGPDNGADGAWTGVDDGIADAIAEATRTHLTALTDGPSGGPLEGDASNVNLGGGQEGALRDGGDRARPGAQGTATQDPQAQSAPMRDRPLRGRIVPGRHVALPLLIAQAAERIAESLAGLKTRWCIPDHDQAGYRVPAPMRQLIERRDRRCCFPGCRRPVRHCDADRSVPYQCGGPTCPCNIALLCRYHHRIKQTPGWRLEHLWPGVILWISPSGHWRITAPADRE